MISNYTDYIEYLSEEYVRRKEETSYFSYGFVADKIGVKSRSNVYRLFKGDRLFTVPLAIRLSKVLGLSHSETDYFVTLTLLIKSTTKAEREFLEAKAKRLRVELVESDK